MSGVNGFFQDALAKISSFTGFAGGQSVSPLFTTMIDAREQARVNQLEIFRNYYNGIHFAYAAEEGPNPYVNLCYAMIEKTNTWLFGKPPVIKARKDIHPIIETLYTAILNSSGGERFYAELGQMGAVSGDAVIQLFWDREANYGTGGVKFRVLDSQKTFLEYRNVGNEMRLSRVLITWEEMLDNGKLALRAELWDSEKVLTFPLTIPLGLSGIPKIEQIVPTLERDRTGSEYITYPNPYKELPFVHIRNIIVPQNVYGRSDLHDLWILNRELNESLNMYKENVRYHGSPITLLYGISANRIERGAHQVWGNLPIGGKVENLVVADIHEAVLKYMGILEKYAGFSQFPVHLFELTEHISNDTSSAALKLLFLPLLELVDKKQVTYGAGLKAAFEAALRITDSFLELGLSSLDGLDPRVGGNLEEIPKNILSSDQKEKLRYYSAKPFWETEIRFQEFMPRNRTMEVADIIAEVNANLESLEGGLTRLDEADPEGKMKQILETQIFLGQAAYLKAAATAGQEVDPESPFAPEPPPDGGDTGSTGTSGSATAATPATEATKPTPPEQGGKTPKESVNQVQNRTGQPADRTAAQRAVKGKGGV